IVRDGEEDPVARGALISFAARQSTAQSEARSSEDQAEAGDPGDARPDREQGRGGRAKDLREEIAMVDAPLIVHRAMRAAIEEVELERELCLPAETEGDPGGVADTARLRAIEHAIEPDPARKIKGD